MSDNVIKLGASSKNGIQPNSRVLITGASGSVGTALVKQLLNDGHTVCAYDQDEDGLFQLGQNLTDCAGNLRLFLGNVRDKDRLHRAMENVTIVFHCAALKHVYLSEYNPFEAMQTNITGVNNVIESAISAGVERVIFTSSDKAVNPTSTMGATKLLGERLFISANHFSRPQSTKFSCVRFGNVLNSNGSVLQIFKRQLENKQPLTITSKDMTRFFLTMSQAVELCISSASKMLGGEIFVRNMGTCDILSLAKALKSGNPVDYIEIGNKPGEKLFEELVTDSEAPRTVLVDDTYVIIPDTLDMMPEAIKRQYAKFEDLQRLTESLRSDHNVMQLDNIISLLKTADDSY
jgi:FlaA1/EpsC-like NDP-sugar epimerase